MLVFIVDRSSVNEYYIHTLVHLASVIISVSAKHFNKGYIKNIEQSLNANFNTGGSMTEEQAGENDKVVFTDEQIAELKQAFALFDMDGSGEVSTDELGTVLETLGQKVTQEELVQIIAEVDQDGGGSVDFDEFVDLMSSRMSENNEEYDIIDVFKVFDQDGSGYITAAELRHVMMNLDEELTDKEIDNLICEADVDGDGQIGYDEFKRLIIHL